LPLGSAVSLANNHLLTPAMWVVLKKKNLTDELPDELRDYLRELHQLSKERNAQLRAQLLEAVRQLNRIDITPVLLKGAMHLVTDVYGDTGAQIMTDIDLLVPREKINECLPALHGLGLERDAEHSYLAGDDMEAGAMNQLLGHAITYRIAVGPQQGRKVFTLQTLPACDEPFDDPVGKVAGFSLHAGVAAKADERKKLERLCRYIARPAVSEKRLSLTSQGQVRYELKTPYRDGTTHVIFEPLDFIAKLAALVPRPRVNLTRFHGVFAPNSKHRIQVTPAKRGKGKKTHATDEPSDQTATERYAAMTWAQRLKRVFNIDIETCPECGGAVKIIACIEDPVVIKKILIHLDEKAAVTETIRLPECRAPPQPGVFELG